jgi:hypothetical protein
MTEFLYHFKHQNMQGEVLYPLNRLKELFPEIYDFQVSKYLGREFLLKEKVPLLDCLWNDVLHLGPIHPQKVLEARLKIGLTHRSGAEFYQIPLSKIDAKKTVIFHYRNEDAEMSSTEVDFFDPEKYRELARLPGDTLAYYQRCFDRGEQPLQFHRVPHILTLSEIDISDCPIITWK